MSSPDPVLERFAASLHNATPPEHLTPALEALWWDGKGDWNKAHQCAQSDESAAGAWVHAYLHRKEGDLANAAYWYRRAGKAIAGGPLADEWSDIVRTSAVAANG